MLTILEVSNFVDPRASERQRAGAGRVRWVIVRPGEGTWTQAHGRELLIEHVEGRRVGNAEQRVLGSAARLRALVQLHRPSVIVCGSPALMPALVHMSGFRLAPRPALIGAWQADVAGALVRRELGRVDRRLASVGARALGWWTEQGLGSLDAVVVGSRSAARELWGRGLDRIFVAPRGVDLERFSPDLDGSG
ncbi:glycosyltransferase, partial [Enhygromyxa salina]|uniref:glycosyltransferase n=1 Tax=Enhygromyxa salina TaxID=215803 RepID=UPI0011B2488F